MAKILITRTSSFGDVAMLVPVIFSVAAKYPQDRFIVLTRKAFAPLFENLGFNINAMTFDPKKHSGPIGTIRLLLKVGNYGFSHVADVHDVLRTKLIRKYMVLLGKTVRHIDKGRGDKQRMISTKIVTPPLTSTTDRYRDVFQRLGFNTEMVFKNFFEFSERSLYPLRRIATEKHGNWVGIAPFSKHKEKIYPLDRMKYIVKKLAEDPSVTVFLFGAGSEEKKELSLWEKGYTNVINVSGKINLRNELLLISYLDVMVSMDSANMHLASLVETPVVSVWGATHPNLGFFGFGQKEEDAIQTDIECRPCSVYGEIPCKRKDYACLTRIKEETVLNKIQEYLKPEAEEVVEQPVDIDNVDDESETIIAESSVFSMDIEDIEIEVPNSMSFFKNSSGEDTNISANDNEDDYLAEDGDNVHPEESASPVFFNNNSDLAIVPDDKIEDVKPDEDKEVTEEKKDPKETLSTWKKGYYRI